MKEEFKKKMEGELKLEELTEQEMEVVMTVFRRFKNYDMAVIQRG